MIEYILTQIFCLAPESFYGEYGLVHVKLASICAVFLIGIYFVLRGERKKVTNVKLEHCKECETTPCVC